MESYSIRPATLQDMPDLRRVYDSAKRYMDETGNPNQWKIGHPPSEIITDDISKGQLYVIETDSIHAVFALIPGVDPTYLKIDGEWLCDRPYAALHRVASDGSLIRVLDKAVSFAHGKYPSLDLRIDTHRENSVMQKAIARCGFKQCGVIYLANGDPRVAFQLCNQD